MDALAQRQLERPEEVAQKTCSTELGLAGLRAAAARHERAVVRSFPIEGPIRSFILARGDR